MKHWNQTCGIRKGNIISIPTRRKRDGVVFVLAGMATVRICRFICDIILKTENRFLGAFAEL